MRNGLSSFCGEAALSENNPYSPPTSDSPPHTVAPFSLVRVISLAALTAMGCLVFFDLNLLVVTLSFTVLNGLFALIFLLDADRRIAGLAFLSSLMFLLTALNSDWGFSSPEPTVQLSWLTFLPALAMMATWIAWPLLPFSPRWQQ